MDELVRMMLRTIGTGTAPPWQELQRMRELRGGEQLVSTCLRAKLVQAPFADVERVEALLATMKAEGPAIAALMVEQYWRFYLSERVAQRRTRKLLDRGLESDRTGLKIAFHFLRFVLSRAQALADVTASDVTAWVRQAPSSHVARLAPFLKWLCTSGITNHRFTLPAAPISAATSVAEPEYHAMQRRAHDEALPLAARVALLLMTKCARYPREIVEVATTNVRRAGSDLVWIRFKHGMPQPLEGADAQLLKELLRLRRAERRVWIFPSKPRPEVHMTSHGLCGLLDAAGIHVNLNHLRNAAFRDLLKDFTPTELCEVLGLGAGVADHWRRRGYTLSRSQRTYANKLSRQKAAAAHV